MGRKLRTGIRAASKVQERELIRKAKALRDQPDALVPRCLPDACPRCPFDALLRKLEKVAEHAEDEDKLERLARRGHPLARAYAATLLLAVQERAAYLAPAKTPYGTVHYARRGKASQQELIGAQYYDVPELRLLTVGAWARKKGIHVYSLANEMVTTCREDRPPAPFVEQTLDRVKVTLRQVDGERRCPHADREPALVVLWRGADTKVVLCARCSLPDRNLPATVETRMVAPRLKDAFDVALRMNLGCAGEACGLGQDRGLRGEAADAYRAGKKSERDLLGEEVPRALRGAAEEGALLVARTCFEADLEAFLNANQVPEDLRQTFHAVWAEREEGLYVPEGSLAKVLDALEEDDVERLVRAMVEDEEMATALLEATEAEGRSREDVLHEARALLRNTDVLRRLPVWEGLPPLARTVDGIARAYKTQGPDEASLRARKAMEGGRREKIVGMAFLEALESAAGKEWAVRQEERQLADFLAPTAKELLEADGEGYRDALQRILTASGSGESLPGP